jgi:hypothetical protein
VNPTIAGWHVGEHRIRSLLRDDDHRCLGFVWPAALQVLRSGFATHSLQVLRVTADPSGCPFVPAFRQDIPGRSVLQAPMSSPGGSGTSFSSRGAEALCFPEAL